MLVGCTEHETNRWATASFGFLAFFLYLLQLQMGTRKDFPLGHKYIATSSVWRSYALVALGGVMKRTFVYIGKSFYSYLYQPLCFLSSDLWLS
jgi:hypothetical protein